jgi:hypothetical protein
VCVGPHLLQEPHWQVRLESRYIQLAPATSSDSILMGVTIDLPGNAAASWTAVQSQYVEDNGVRQHRWYKKRCMMAHYAS